MQVIENAFDWLDAPRFGCTALDCALARTPTNLEKLALPQPEWIIDAVKKLI